MPAQTSVPIRLPGSFPPNVPHPSGYNASPLPPPSDYYVSRRELVEVIPDLGVMKSVPSATADTVVLFDGSGQVKSSGVKLSDKADTETVETLVGEDPGRSARDIAKDEVSRLLGDSPDELYDTFTEVAGFIDESKKNYRAVDTALGGTAKTLEGKQDKLGEAQLAAVDSGVTSETVKQVEANKTALGGKVDKDGAKVLSDNNFTNADKKKLGEAYTPDNPPPVPNLNEVVAMSELSGDYPQGIPAVKSVELRGGEVSDGVDVYTLPNAIIYADRVDITNPGEEKQTYYPPWSKSVIDGTLQLPWFNGDESATDYWGNRLYDKSHILASVDSVTFKEVVDKAEYLYSSGGRPFSDVFPVYLHAMYGHFLEASLDEYGQVTFKNWHSDMSGMSEQRLMMYRGDTVLVEMSGGQQYYRLPWCDEWGMGYNENGVYGTTWDGFDIATRYNIKEYIMSLQRLDFYVFDDSSTSRTASFSPGEISFSQYDQSMGVGKSWSYSPGVGMRRSEDMMGEAIYRFPWDSGWGTWDDGSGYVQTTWDSYDLATRGDIAQYVSEYGGEVHIYKDAGVTGGMYNISIDLSWANNSPMPDGMIGSFPGLLAYYTSTNDYYPVKEARYMPDSVYLRSSETDGAGTVMSQTEMNIMPTGISSTTSGSYPQSWQISASGIIFTRPSSEDPAFPEHVELTFDTMKKLINLVNNT